MTTLAMPRPRRDSGMEGMVAKWYASNTREMMKEYVDLAHRIASQLASGDAVLEVAPGPGYFSIELAKLGNFSITGLDLSHTFVKLAEMKAAKEGLRINFRQGTASNMPFPSDTFDFLLCRAAFKNFGQPVEALKEMCRVLKPGGRAIIIDLKGDASPNAISDEVDHMGLSSLNRILTKLIFKKVLLKRAYTREHFEQMLSQAAFSKVEIVDSGLGLEVSMTK